jgi:cytochrome b subunit of formate dehydrogenase
MTIGIDTPRAFRVSPWLKKISRISAWALLVGILVLVISGWGITQTGVIYNITFGLIDRRLADAIHRETNVPLAVFFLTHVMINIKIATSFRDTFRGWLINGFLVVIGIGLLTIVVYMEYFRLGG